MVGPSSSTSTLYRIYNTYSPNSASFQKRAYFPTMGFAVTPLTYLFVTRENAVLSLPFQALSECVLFMSMKFLYTFPILRINGVVENVKWSQKNMVIIAPTLMLAVWDFLQINAPLAVCVSCLTSHPWCMNPKAIHFAAHRQWIVISSQITIPLNKKAIVCKFSHTFYKTDGSDWLLLFDNVPSAEIWIKVNIVHFTNLHKTVLLGFQCSPSFSRRPSNKDESIRKVPLPLSCFVLHDSCCLTQRMFICHVWKSMLLTCDIGFHHCVLHRIGIRCLPQPPQEANVIIVSCPLETAARPRDNNV